MIADHLRKDGTPSHDLGGRYFDDRARDALERDLVRRLERLGHTVTLTPAA